MSPLLNSLRFLVSTVIYNIWHVLPSLILMSTFSLCTYSFPVLCNKWRLEADVNSINDAQKGRMWQLETGFSLNLMIWSDGHWSLYTLLWLAPVCLFSRFLKLISLNLAGFFTLLELFQMQVPDVQDVSVFPFLTSGSTWNLSAPVWLPHNGNLQLLK